MGVYKGKLLFFGVAKRVVIRSSGDFLPDLITNNNQFREMCFWMKLNDSILFSSL